MKSRPLAIVAVVLFVVSFVLPAFSGYNGFQCLRACWEIVAVRRDPEEFWFRIYYGSFLLANAFFVTAFAINFFTERFRYTRITLTLLAFFDVLSWLVYNLTKEGDPHRLEIQVGYFVWLAAYVLLFVSQLLETQKPAVPAPVKPANENAS